MVHAGDTAVVSGSKPDGARLRTGFSRPFLS
jgi:hypothetical protein